MTQREATTGHPDTTGAHDPVDPVDTIAKLERLLAIQAESGKKSDKQLIERRRKKRHLGSSIKTRVVETDSIVCSTLPPDSEYMPVQCYDVSDGGISLLFPTYVSIRRRGLFLIRFNVGSRQVDILARIQRVEQVAVDADNRVYYIKRTQDPPKDFDPTRSKKVQMAGLQFLRNL